MAGEGGVVGKAGERVMTQLVTPVFYVSQAKLKMCHFADEPFCCSIYLVSHNSWPV